MKTVSLSSDAQHGQDVVATTAAVCGAVYLRLPDLWVDGHSFYCDGDALSFLHARRRLSLLQAFLTRNGCRLNREQILAIVYGENQLRRRSPRYVDCLNMNILRIISDTRRLLYLKYAKRYPGIDWLYFNRGEKKWKLIRFKDSYVLAQISTKILYSASQRAQQAVYSERYPEVD